MPHHKMSLSIPVPPILTPRAVSGTLWFRAGEGEAGDEFQGPDVLTGALM